MKKKWILLALSIVLIGALFVIGILYNIPDIRIGMTHSADGTVNFPSITCNTRLGIGMSKSA